MGWTVVSPNRPITGTGQNLNIGASSVASSAFGSATQIIRVSATGNCRVQIGKSPTAVSTDALIKSTDDPVYFKVDAGEKIAVIQDGASVGTLSVIECTH